MDGNAQNLQRTRMNREGKILYLVRHAKSSWKDATLADRDRPLNGRGKRNSPDMGKRMREQGHQPGLVIASPAKRALATAGNIARELGIDESGIVADENLYFSGASAMREVLARVDDRYRKVMMVGHNPDVTLLLNSLADSGVIDMPTCGIAIIGFDMASWAGLHSTRGVLLAYDTPKSIACSKRTIARTG